VFSRVSFAMEESMEAKGACKVTRSAEATEAYIRRIEEYRKRRDEFFKSNENTPLLPEQRERFRGLRYYPVKPEYRFVVELQRDGVSQERVILGTTTGEPKEFIVAGRVTVEIEGKPVTFTVYREVGRGRYFLPFRDTTAGSETYSVGRYLDPQETPDGKLVIDFNMAYNPYCAYNDRWTCPIPPRENIVDVPIRAGEMAYPDYVSITEQEKPSGPMPLIGG
jgi:uncharacterized protein (DUF1684 family)